MLSIVVRVYEYRWILCYINFEKGLISFSIQNKRRVEIYQIFANSLKRWSLFTFRCVITEPYIEACNYKAYIRLCLYWAVVHERMLNMYRNMCWMLNDSICILTVYYGFDSEELAVLLCAYTDIHMYVYYVVYYTITHIYFILISKT